MFQKVAHSPRKSTPRSTNSEARAKLVPTSHNRRRIEIFLTQQLYSQAEWKMGGTLTAKVALIDDALILALSPSHDGLRMLPTSPTTTTCRVSISGDFICPTACAPVRRVKHALVDGAIHLYLPREWHKTEVA